MLRFRVKVPADAAICMQCFEPGLSTDGKRVVCKCGAVTTLADHGKEAGIFIRKVKREVTRLNRTAHRRHRKGKPKGKEISALAASGQAGIETGGAGRA